MRLVLRRPDPSRRRFQQRGGLPVSTGHEVRSRAGRRARGAAAGARGSDVRAVDARARRPDRRRSPATAGEGARHLQAQPFIDRIEIIPDTYLRPRGGFDNLEQIARLQGLDIVALVSYDQVADTGETAASFLYWTIIGAYTVPATRNQVSTFVETTVFHVDSRTLLLRAPGQDQRDAGSTAIRVGDTRERLGREGFRAAMDDMSANLDVAIADFSTRVREEGQVKLVDRRSGGSWRGRGGGGSLGLWELGALLGALALLLAARRRG
ncbi:rhombotarget lipoprotein [Luteimonas sp BLCC-B24]|nr:rhombotarget lipoprotein [Luteimonas sp. BLCC-B24]MDC7808245.1 rhombotarget lipoprotein [Luteimonas sp. BLCC-B24]